ncbi:LPXTG cell wall anchor domain-containing protein [Arthrobacter sp. NPDC097144]|uniref:LPXTG cell wall anchor domain-containing protein n=1 Tax=Arthrobacter sp. NPDC097144 TaxID=3363946 RepID=UPI00380235C0
MQDNSTAFYKRVGALGAATALAVGGTFFASPAIAAPAAEPDTTSAPVTATAEAPVDATAADGTISGDVALTEAAPAEEAGTLPPGLAEALLRDLGMTVEEFEAAGELGKKAAEALPELQATEGFAGIALEDGKIIITGSGEAIEALALKLDALLVAPATTEADVEPEVKAPAPTETATDAPSAEAPAASEEPKATEEPAAGEETASPLSLTGDYRANIEKIRADYIANVGVAGLQSIMWNGAGYVISVDKQAAPGGSVLSKSPGAAAESSVDAIAQKYANVTVAQSSGTATPVEDVVNGQGYASPVADGAALCSIGFNGYNSTGEAAVITAGHCAHDGEVTEALLTDPTGDPASGTDNPSLLAELGTWGFSQFGGVNNSPVDLQTGANVGTDVAVINSIDNNLNLLPEVTQWEDAKDLTAATTKITGTADAVVGAPVCKSGRTTGWSCGEVTGVGDFFVGGHKGTEEDIRGVFGFESTLTTNAKPGDSGGSTISGSNAMGINSAVGDREGVERMLSASLSDGLTHLGGYTVAMFVEAPALTSHENKGTVLTDQRISGTAPAGSTVKLTQGGKTADLAVENGVWSFTAPSTVPAEKLEFKVQAVNGFNKSKTSSYELTVQEAPLAAPVITNPAAGAQIVDSLTTITGTGIAKAKVTVDVTGVAAAEKPESKEATAAIEGTATATVDADGSWTVKLDKALSYGDYTVTATQDGIEGKRESPAAASEFAVILAAPAITSVTEGQKFDEGSNPRDISGTGTAGAKVSVSIGDTTLTAQVADNGSWAVNGFPALKAGDFTVNAVQTLNGAESAATAVSFTVNAVVEVAPQGPQPTPAPAPAPGNNSGGLPHTGAAGMGFFTGAGALLMAGGISALLINRRRQAQDA